MSNDVRDLWDRQAATFDDAPDHGLTDAATRSAWATLLHCSLHDPDCAIADLGCGTGSVSALLAERGHEMLGVDLSPKMIELARAKAQLAELDIEFVVGDVQTMSVPAAPYGAIFSRHVLWAVPDPTEVVERWSAPLTDDGVFIAVEGLWNQAGIAPADAFALLEPHFEKVEYTDLSNHDVLWGKAVTDHRYVMVARQPRR